MKALGGVLLLAVASAHVASASLISTGPISLGGTGLGAVNTVLTLTSPGNSTVESGCVGFVGGTTVIGSGACTGGATGGNELTGASQTQVRLLSEAGVTSLANLRVILNATEPAGNSITVNNLALQLYSPTGTLLFTSGAFSQAPLTFPETFPGIGNAGFGFQLDNSQLAAAVAAVGNQTLGNVRVGLSATLSNATGGPETFFIASAGTGGGPENTIPEPSTYAMLAGGLISLGLLRKRVRS